MLKVLQDTACHLQRNSDPHLAASRASPAENKSLLNAPSHPGTFP